MKKKQVRKQSEFVKPYTGKKVARCDDNGNIIEIYETATDCYKAGYTNAKKVLLGQRERCKGFKFKYLD